MPAYLTHMVTSMDTESSYSASTQPSADHF